MHSKCQSGAELTRTELVCTCIILINALTVYTPVSYLLRVFGIIGMVFTRFLRDFTEKVCLIFIFNRFGTILYARKGRLAHFDLENFPMLLFWATFKGPESRKAVSEAFQNLTYQTLVYTYA